LAKSFSIVQESKAKEANMYLHNHQSLDYTVP